MTVSIKIASTEPLPWSITASAGLFRKELEALCVQKRTGQLRDGPVLFRYGPLTKAASQLSLKEKQKILEALAKGWVFVADQGMWSSHWALEQIELAEQACYGALTLINAKLVKLDDHVDKAGHTNQAKAIRRYISEHLHELENAIVTCVVPRLRSSKNLIMKATMLVERERDTQ